MQLIRRNEELALLYEKIRINESTLEKGAQQYGTRNREVTRARCPPPRGDNREVTVTIGHHRELMSPCLSWRRRAPM